MIKEKMIGVLVVIGGLIWMGIFSTSAASVDVMPDEYQAIEDQISGDMAELLPKDLFSEDPQAVMEAAQTMTRPEYLFRMILEAVGLKLQDVVTLLCTLIGLLLLSAALHRLNGVLPGRAGEGVTFILRLCMYSLIILRASDMILWLKSYEEGLTGLMTGLIPAMGILYVMGGNVTQAAASEELLMIFLQVCQYVIGTITPTVCCICLSMSLMDVFGSGLQIKLTALGNFIKKWYTILLGFVMFLLNLTLSTRTMLSGGADTLSMKGIKYAVGQMIPVVGGAVAGTMGSISAGLGMLRKVTGVSGIILVGLFLLPTLIQLLLFRMCYQMAGTAAIMLDCDGEGKLLNEMGSLYGYMAAAHSICASVCVLALGIFANTAVAFA